MLLKKNTQGYNYKYADLAQINKLLEENDICYRQEVVTDYETNKDYIYTTIIDKDGKESKPYRGAEIVKATLQGKSNPAQEYGSSLTYARRYSLYLCFGLACEDDDGAKFDGAKKIENIPPLKELKPVKITSEQIKTITQKLEELHCTAEETQLDLQNFKVNEISELSNSQADNYIKALNMYDKIRAKRNTEKAILDNAKGNKNG